MTFSEKPVKFVLFADDIAWYRDVLPKYFLARNAEEACPYHFEVDVADSLDAAGEKVRDKRKSGKEYDVIVMDQSLPPDNKAPNKLGIAEGVFGFALEQEARPGRQFPIIIVFTIYPDVEPCVTAMRYGAWDYISKRRAGETGQDPSERVVDSAVHRLRELDLHETLNREIGVNWVPRNSAMLAEHYAGKIIALWHKPHVEVVASGRDAFELARDLNVRWRTRPDYEPWMQPFILRVPPEEP
jgi:CheY-like chemotaxis protein